MKLRKYKHLLTFLCLFYFSMAISKYAQVLWFEKEDALVNFSLSYSAMAIAGAFSFMLSRWVSQMTIKKAMHIFIPIYAIGLVLRVFPSSTFIAIISGAIAGVGAATVLLIVRTWIYELTDENEEDKAFIVSSRYTVMQIAATVSTLIAGQILFFAKETAYTYVGLLILGAVLLMTTLLMKKFPDGHVLKKDKLIMFLPDNKRVGIILYIVVIILGISVSLVEPLLPVIISDNGFNASLTSIIVSIYGLLKVASSFLFQKTFFSAKPQITFFLIEIILGGIFVGYGLVDANGMLLISIILVLSIGSAGFFIFKEMMEYEMLPKKELHIYLGLLQSSFLIGDSIGSPLGTTIYVHLGLSSLFIVFGFISCIAGLLYFSLFYYMRSKFKNSRSI
ncbi:MFS transporter [Listeria booriae]|uniref:MFS transporter n=1 Tax=Listeria booriae TaxID=1552123 RepID=UPI001627E2D2|nr:MFS transporter [Listeria booriae]MBC1334729.1 MFS transporter [Listeria booriae]MBC1651597.1 MFS transporter [Listeria booriae]MBC1943602.1 MFS transporter [Listeria booriae]MBC6129998.1 MFS transporter [Listeria booriae]MBC6135879.1 MFS transporter [Listeria booriae]